MTSGVRARERVPDRQARVRSHTRTVPMLLVTAMTLSRGETQSLLPRPPPVTGGLPAIQAGYGGRGVWSTTTLMEPPVAGLADPVSITGPQGQPFKELSSPSTSAATGHKVQDTRCSLGVAHGNAIIG
jgi:hypothetical protein